MASFFGPPPFSQEEAQSHVSIQDEFAETWLLMPKRKIVNQAVQDDSSRPQVTFRGVFAWESKDARLGLAETAVSSREPELTIERSALPYDPMPGDQVVSIDRRVGFEIKQSNPDGMSGICLLLVQIGRNK